MTTQAPDVEVLQPEVSNPEPSTNPETSASVTFPSTPGNDSTDLSADLLRGRLKFSSAENLREFLTRLLVLMTEGRVTPRRAAVLAYITNQLLHTHSVLLKEEELENESQPILFDLPRPNRD